MEEPSSRDTPGCDRAGAETSRSSDRRVPVSVVDVGVGDRIRRRRQDLHMSQDGLAERAGILPQQLQMYERGEDRVSPAHLCTLATVLGVPLSYFFHGLVRN